MRHGHSPLRQPKRYRPVAVGDFVELGVLTARIINIAIHTHGDCSSVGQKEKFRCLDIDAKSQRWKAPWAVKGNAWARSSQMRFPVL